LTYEISDTNPQGDRRTLTGFGTKYFYYNKDGEVDSDGNLLLKPVYPAYGSTPIVKNEGFGIIIEDIHFDKYECHLD